MKKRYKSRSAHSWQQVSRIDQKRFQGDITTIFYNVAATITYGVFLELSMDNLAGTITFFVLAMTQMAICAVLGFNYNSKMWLISALAIFLMSCGAFVYVNM